MAESAAAVVAAPAAAPAAASVAAPVAAPAAPAGLSWLPADADPELIGHAQNAGWQGPADAVKSHRELQKLFGADRHGRTITLPKEDATPEEVAAFYEKLGRPKSPEEYGLKPPEGADGKFLQAAAQKMHELGLPTKAAQAMAAWYQEQAGALDSAQAEAEQAALQAEHAALQKDWGTGPAAMEQRELAKRAAERLGLDEAAIDAMEKVVGFSKTMKALAKMGELMRESGAVGLNELNTFGLTPEAARSKKTQLMADAEWRKKAMNPASAEWAEMQKLNGVIAAAMQ